MPVTARSLITQADLDDLADLANTKLASVQAAPYEFDPLATDWIDQFSAIRIDLLSNSKLNDDTSPAFTFTDDWLLSGPWCVASGHRLFCQIRDEAGNWFYIYDDMEFWYAADDEPVDLNIKHGITMGTPEYPVFNGSGSPSGGTVIWTARLRVNTDQAGRMDAQQEWRFVWAGGGSAPADPPDLGDLTYSATPSTGVTWSITGTGAAWSLIATIGVDYSSGNDQLLDFSVTEPDDYDSEFGSESPFVPPYENRARLTGFYDFLDTNDTDEAVTAIHSSSACKKIPLARSATATDVLYVSGSSEIKLDRVYEASDPDLPGVYVCKSLPVPAVHSFLTSDLPNYKSLDASSTARPRLSAPPPGDPVINPHAPSVSPRPARWPVFRDTDFGEWLPNIASSALKLPVPYWEHDQLHVFDYIERTLSPGETYLTLMSVPAAGDYQVLKLALTDPNIVFYVSDAGTPDPDDPGSYDFTGTEGFKIPDDVPPAELSNYEGGLAFILLKNPTAAAITFEIRRTFFYVPDGDLPYPGDYPLFRPTDDSGRAYFEDFSYCLDGGNFSVSVQNTEIPERGYCVTEILVRRKPVNNGFGIALAPSTGEAELEIKIGVMRGATDETPGTFIEFTTLTIPADEADSGPQAVFWPVILGAPLAYQCDEAVMVFAQCNFQPLILTQFTPVVDANALLPRGTYSGRPMLAYQDYSLFRFASFGNSTPGSFTVTFPLSATVYNDLEALLNLL